jgi:hypothetical protein
MGKAIFLIAIGVVFNRLIPHPVNAVPIGALALFAGVTLSRRWAWIVPVAAMALSDLVIDPALGRPLLDVSRLIIYATVGATTLLGPLAKRPKVGRWLLPALSLSASTLFFLTTNFAAWLVLPQFYPRTFAGLMLAYAEGIPYFQNTVLADLAGTAVFFGLGWLLQRAFSSLTAAETALEPAQTHPTA